MNCNNIVGPREERHEDSRKQASVLDHSVLQCARQRKWDRGASNITLLGRIYTVGAEVGEKLCGVIGTEYFLVLVISSV